MLRGLVETGSHQWKANARGPPPPHAVHSTRTQLPLRSLIFIKVNNQEPHLPGPPPPRIPPHAQALAPQDRLKEKPAQGKPGQRGDRTGQNAGAPSAPAGSSPFLPLGGSASSGQAPGAERDLLSGMPQVSWALGQAGATRELVKWQHSPPAAQAGPTVTHARQEVAGGSVGF